MPDIALYDVALFQPEAIDTFRKTIRETSVETVVTFNKGIFNLVSKEIIERCINRLMEGELIQSQIMASRQSGMRKRIWFLFIRQSRGNGETYLPSLSLPDGIVYHYLLNCQLQIRAAPTTLFRRYGGLVQYEYVMRHLFFL